jgi:hypothetical protein
MKEIAILKCYPVKLAVDNYDYYNDGWDALETL